MTHNYQKGVALYFAVVITTILLAIVLGLTTILVSQLKIIRGMGDSVIAFFAADTGMEETLYNIYGQGKLEEAFLSWDGGNREYDTTISIESIGGVTSTVVRSGGRYKEIRRAIQVSLIDVTSPLITPTEFPITQVGAIFTIQVNISGLGGVEDFPTAGIVGGTPSSIDLANTVDITYEGTWDSTGNATGTSYTVNIYACDNDSPQHCADYGDYGTIEL